MERQTPRRRHPRGEKEVPEAMQKHLPIGGLIAPSAPPHGAQGTALPAEMELQQSQDQAADRQGHGRGNQRAGSSAMAKPGQLPPIWPSRAGMVSDASADHIDDFLLFRRGKESRHVAL